MIPLDRTTASSSLPSRRIAACSYPAHGRNTQTVTPGPTRRRASSSASTSRRRSVSSMKGLMPLALSPACSSSSSLSPAEERMGNKVDGYFPEVLAKDLESSNSTFTARNMTSGPPDSALSIDDKTRPTGSPWPYRSFSSPYHASSCPVRALGPIQERSPVVSFLDDYDCNYDETSTDPGSVSGTDVSRGPAAPSISFREQSIITAATSLTSSSWVPSPRHSPPCDLAREHSWIDADSDEDEPEPSDNLNGDNLATLSPRPPTPPDSDNDVEARTECQEQAPSSSYNKKLHRKSHSISGGAPISLPRRRQSGRRSESSEQRPTWTPTQPLGQHYSFKARPHAESPTVHRQRSSSLQTPRSHHYRSPSLRNEGANKVLRFSTDTRPATEPAIMGDGDLVSDDEDGPMHRRKSSRRNPVFIQPSPPPSPLPSVQSWLNGSIGPYTSQCLGDDLAKAVPLPPNVVETLRVSIACFPETMLLTSSLTVETIRNYSKKVRHPSAEMMNSQAPDSPGDSPRRSLWKRVVSYKRGASSPERRLPHSTAPGSTLRKSPSSTSLEAPKPWAPLKNVFGYCSDYICDALWAHLVAYNYISTLVPRTPSQPRPARVCSPAAESQKEEIPKKAASLLGLAVSQDMSASVDRVAKKLTSQMSWGLKDGMVAEQSSRSAHYENATRDIQAGLMRCIMRLIATAKLMAEEGTTDDRVVEMETRGVDVLFTRSLCEIVRMAEESG